MDRAVACGDYDGFLTIYDVESGKSKFQVKAHNQIINCMDGVGGKGPEYGAPEIVTGSRDGTKRVIRGEYRLRDRVGPQADRQNCESGTGGEGRHFPRLLGRLVSP